MIFGILGLGIFGTKLSEELEQYGHDVIAIDNDMKTVEEVAQRVRNVICADINDIEQLKETGISECDAVVITTADSLETTITAILNVQSLGVNEIYVKVKDAKGELVMNKLGINKIIRPERDMAVRYAKKLSAENLVDLINIDDHYSIIEIKPLEKWIGKTLAEANIRNEYNINIIGVKRNNKTIMTLTRDFKFENDDVVMAIAENKRIGDIK